jgi:hypothetical protein
LRGAISGAANGLLPSRKVDRAFGFAGSLTDRAH